MAEIPLDKDYLRKHYPDKYKELEKNKASSPASQSKDNKHCSKAETPSPIFTIGEELQDFYYGGIKLPTEFDKYIQLSKGSGPREFKISETARLAKMSGYVVKHLRRWEQEKVTGTIEHIYRAYLHPFTYRVKQIEPDCERMKPLLAFRMNTIGDNFEERYKNLLLVANKVEEKRDHNFRAAIEEFKVATILLCDTVQMIHNEALCRIVEYSKLQGSKNKKKTKRRKQSSNAGETENEGVLTGEAKALKETRRKKKQKKLKRNIKDLFSFAPGQVSFDGKDIGLPTGLPVEVLQKLVDSFCITVAYGDLDDNISGKTADEQLRRAKKTINDRLLTAKVLCKIVTKPREGYCLCKTIPNKKPHKRATRKPH